MDKILKTDRLAILPIKTLSENKLSVIFAVQAFEFFNDSYLEQVRAIETRTMLAGIKSEKKILTQFRNNPVFAHAYIGSIAMNPKNELMFNLRKKHRDMGMLDEARKKVIRNTVV
ncbi:MAG: hypothetical protein FWD89_03565 [Firmicutes bacterium]|nr:hypothetical protein [Bacillota bacterium]